MKPIDEIERRWSRLFNTSIGVDLRQAIQVQNQQDHLGAETANFDPCEEGLRSVCWRSFLLHGPLSKGSWTKKLSESRSGYSALRDHFLRFIDNPNDVHSSVSVDPLTDDETSPWATLRNDEEIREEIMRDVSRCYQDNYFFREPPTQKKLLDILFIYAKLNPDTGYRQGMHELLAPIVWVVSQDSLDPKLVLESMREQEGVDLMIDVLDQKFIEHDSFGLFCAVMQTAKSFYTIGGETRDSSAIIAQSEKVHKELLAAVEPSLADHLTTIGLLPQVYCLPWIRLLMGRIFELGELLKLWDALFAERLTHEIVEWTCVAILLRMYWKLIDADYASSITTVTRFKLQDSPRSLVKDAMYLSRWKSPDAGAYIVEKYSERRPYRRNNAQFPPTEPILSSTPPSSRPKRMIWPQYTTSSSSSPTRYPTPQRQLEGIFADVQKRTEGWGVGSVSKALRGAVGEVRKNVNSFQATHSRETSVDYGYPGPLAAAPQNIDPAKTIKELESRFQALEQRNKALAKMLDGAIESLRACRPGNDQAQEKSNDEPTSTDKEDVFNTSLARIQFVSAYLSDTDIQMPSMDVVEGEKTEPKTKPTKSEPITDILDEGNNEKKSSTEQPPESASDSAPHIVKHKPRKSATSKANVSTGVTQQTPKSESNQTTDDKGGADKENVTSSPQVPDPRAATEGDSPAKSKTPRPSSTTTPVKLTSLKAAPEDTPYSSPPTSSTASVPAAKSSHPTRPSLSDSSFSFMLGDERKRSSFVRSVQHRNSDAILSREHLFGASSTADGGDARDNPKRKGSGDKNRRGSGTSGTSGTGHKEPEEDEMGWSMSSLRGGGN